MTGVRRLERVHFGRELYVVLHCTEGAGSNDSKERVKGKRHRPASAIIHPSLIIALAMHAYLFAPSLHLSSRILSPARKPPHPHTYVQHLILIF